MCLIASRELVNVAGVGVVLSILLGIAGVLLVLTRGS